MDVEFGGAQDGDGAAAVAQRQRRAVVAQPLPVGVADGQDDRHALIGHAALLDAVEVQHLAV